MVFGLEGILGFLLLPSPEFPTHRRKRLSHFIAKGPSCSNNLHLDSAHVCSGLWTCVSDIWLVEHYVRGNFWVYELTPGTVDHFIIKVKHLIDGVWARCPLAPQWPWMLLLTSHSHIYVYLIQLLEYCLDISVHQSKYRSLFLILKCQHWVPFYAYSINAQKTLEARRTEAEEYPMTQQAAVIGFFQAWNCAEYAIGAWHILPYWVDIDCSFWGQPREFILEKIGPDNLSQRRLVFAQ